MKSFIDITIALFIGMTFLRLLGLTAMYLAVVEAFWDMGTTTGGYGGDYTPSARESFFRWQRVESTRLQFWKPGWDWVDMAYRRRLNCMAGISIDFQVLSTAAILNQRVLLTAANYLEPYKDRQRDLRIWALGRGGEHNTPYRYRVWHVHRLVPRSANPEHQHGPYGTHCPRHDLAIIKSLDQMYIYPTYPTSYHYAHRIMLPGKYDVLKPDDLLIAASGFHDIRYVSNEGNYKIINRLCNKKDIVDCSKYLPKWWGKFICIKNVKGFAGVQNGGALIGGNYIFGVGCFEIRYNQDRIMVFTDIRYYIDHIQAAAYVWPGMYYEYAYQQWGTATGWIWDDNSPGPFNPNFYKANDLYPLGKK